jgi:tripartite-type tricarboxylate transporter receptor subunit TctC
MEKTMRASTCVCAVSVVLAALGGSAALAEGYPTRAIQLIVPFPAGGSTDLVARAVAEPLRERLGQAVIVENRAGGGGIVGTEAAARAQADGYTIVMGGSGNVALAALNASGRGMDWINDFKPIAIIGDIPNVLVVAADKKLASVADVISRAKAAPGELNYGHAGNGTASHLVGEPFARQAGIKIVPVPYRGNQPAVTDLLGGHIPMMFSNLAGTLPFMEGDKLKILATTGKVRSPLAPNLSTFAEAGIAGLENGVWMGFMAPKGTPDAVIATLAKHIEEVMKQPSTIERLKKLGTETVYAGPAEFSARMTSEYAVWKQIIADANIKLN